MKILIFIFLLLHYINCNNIPKTLRCIDIKCRETISTGRIIKTANSVYGETKILKSNSIVQIKGKNVDSENTLWLIEFDGFPGFVDMTFIKENTKLIRDELTDYPNSYYTENEDDSTTNSGLFSNKKVNDDTEDYTELDEKQSSDTDTDHNILLNDEIQNSETRAMPKERDDKKLLKHSELNKTMETEQDENSLSSKESLQPSEMRDSNVSTELKVNNESIKHDFKEKVSDTNNEEVTSKMVNETSSKNIETAYQNDTKEKILSVDESKQLTKENQDSSEVEQLIFSKTNQDSLKDSNNKEKLNIDSTEIKKDLEVESVNVMKSTNDINTEKKEMEKNSEIPTMEIDSEIKVQKNDVYDNFDTNKRMEVGNIEDGQSQLSSGKDENSSVMTEVTKHLEIGESLNVSSKSAEINLEKKNFPNEQIAGEKTNPVKFNEPVNQIKGSMPLKSHNQLSNKLQNKDHDMPSVEYDKNEKTISEQIGKLKLNDESSTENVKKEQVIDVKENSIESKTVMKPDIVLENKTVTDKEIEKSILNEEAHESSIKVPLVNEKSEPIMKQSEEKINESNKIKNMDNVQVPVVNSDTIPARELLVQATGDPWVGNNERLGSNSDQDVFKGIRSPIIKLVLKLELLAQLLIKSFTKSVGFDSSSKLNQFCNDWLQMPLESFIFIVILFSTLFLFVYTPKILKFNRDWKSEFSRQSQVMGELESKLQSMEEVRQKLTVQNHNFEKVIDDYKQQIIEIQEDAKKNKQTVMLEITKIKKSHESKIKLLTSDLENAIQQTNIFERDLFAKETTIDGLEEEKRNIEIQMEEEKAQLEETINKIQEQLIQLRNTNEDLKNDLQQKINQNEQLTLNVGELHGSLLEKNEVYKSLEKTFAHLKIFDDLDYGEFMEKKEICLDLTNTKDRLELAKNDIIRLENELSQKSNRVIELEETMIEVERKRIEYEKQKAEAMVSQEAAEIKLKVLSDYFKSKEVEMAKSLGHKVIETNQSIDQVDFLKHRVETLENENKEMTSTNQKLKAEVKESMTFASKCKHDANEQINALFLKNSTLERNLILEKDENKKLRTRLSHYVGPTPPRQNVNTSFNHVKDRPPSRQSLNSEPSGLAPFPQLIPIAFLPQSPMQNNQFSGRNSANSKKSNNT